MRRSQANTQDSQCHKGCWVVLRVLLVHVAAVEALLSWVPAPWLGALCISLTGLSTGTEVSATAISAAVGGVSHEALTRVLSGGWWTARLVLLAAVRVVRWVGGAGWLLVDEVRIPKPSARLIAVCRWDFEHALRRNVCGLRLVFVVWCHGWLTLPLGFYVWQKDPPRTLPKKRRRGKPGRPRNRGPKVRSHTRRACAQRVRRRALHQAQQRVRPRTATGPHDHTKNALARVLVWRVVRAGVTVRWVLFDNWYASREHRRGFTRLGLRWVTRLTHPTHVRYQGRTVSVKQVAGGVPPTNYHSSAQLGARARAFGVELFGCPVKRTVVKDDTHPARDRTKYLATNELSLSNTEQVRWYRRRWPSECFFRETKQLLGLGGSPARQPQAVLTHLVLVGVAYVLLPLLKPLRPKPHVSVSQRKKALLPLRRLVTSTGAALLVRLTAEGQCEEVEGEQLWAPVRTRLSGIELPEHLGFP